MTAGKARIRRRRWERRTAATVLVVAVVAIGVVASGRPSTAADDPKPALDPSALSAAVELHRSEADFARLTRQLTDAEASVSSTQASLNVTLGELQVNEAQLAVVTDRVRKRGAEVYQHAGATSTAPLDVEHVQDMSVARTYASTAAAVDTADITRLRALENKLQQERDDKAQVHDQVVVQRDDLQRRHDELGQQRAEQQRALAAAGGVPVMGPSQLSARQLAGWYASTGAVPELAANTTIVDVTALYVAEGDDEDVRGDLAFAQAIIETGSFAVAAGNNYSGIGVCDSCTGGYAFPTPRDGVRAQIQLLRNYADPDSRASNLAHPPSPALYGADPDKAAHLFDSFFLKGKAPLWNLMGKGNWATDPTYAGKVVALYNQMVLFANAHPELAG